MTTFYDRSSNVTPVSTISSLVYSPAYGSRASFQSKANTYETLNGYFNMIPMSVNSLEAKFDLRFDLAETEAQKLVNFIENKNGDDGFFFEDPSNIYQNISGHCDNYAINHINKGHYEVGVSFEVNEAANLLNWSGMTFVETGLTHWATAKNYSKYDVIYQAQNGNTNKLNNYFYCFEDHTSASSLIDGPTGSNSKWTQAFFYEPDAGMQNSVDIKVDKQSFKNSYTQRAVSRKHLATTNFSYKFTNVTTLQAKSILHFLEIHGGFRRFLHSPPSVYNKDKVFYAPSWSHTWKFYNSHDIEVSLIEDPLGVIPTGT